MTNARVSRGRQSQRIAAEFMNDKGFPFAEGVWGSMPGRDITGTPGLAIEVKARRDLNLPGWLRQAAKNANGDLPLLLVRPDGYGEARVGEWCLCLRFDEAVHLLRAAGYGTPLEGDMV